MEIISPSTPVPVKWRRLSSNDRGLAMTRAEGPFTRSSRAYLRPLQDLPNLWNDFANVDERSAHQILAFANTYGWLSEADTELRAVQGYRRPWRVVTYERWRMAILNFRAAIDDYRAGLLELETLEDAVPRYCEVVWSGDGIAVRTDGVLGIAWMQLAEIFRQGREIDVCDTPGCRHHFLDNTQGSRRRRHHHDTCDKRAQLVRLRFA